VSTEPFDDPAQTLEREVREKRTRARLVALGSLVALPAFIYLVYRLTRGLSLGPFEVVIFCALIAVLMTGWTSRRARRR
jgi:hypothetical protein